MTPERNRSSPRRSDDPGVDAPLLSQISSEMVQAQKRYFGRGPTQAKSYIVDDFLIVVMRDAMTTAETTMIELGRGDMVRSFRQEVENELAGRMVGRVQELTGRTIVNHQSLLLFDPHILVELFFFEAAEPESTPEAG